MLKPKKIATILLVVFAVFMVVKAPSQSADYVRDGIGAVAQGVEGLFNFFEALAGV